MTAISDVEIPCSELVELVTDYLDGALSAEDLARVDAHLVECPACLSVVNQFRALIRIGGRIREQDVAEIAPALRAELVAAFRSVHQRRGRP